MNKKVAGCNFMLAPMSDRYIDVILGSVAKVDTSRIWSNTGKMGTVYRGSSDAVLDAVQACFSYAWHQDIHMTLSMTFAEGCPLDDGSDVVVYEGDDTACANAEGLKDVHFPADCKFAYYPMGDDNYIEKINAVVELAKEMGVYKDSMHYATVLKGDVADLFAFFSKAIHQSEETCGQFVYEVTFSVNSPSAD